MSTFTNLHKCDFDAWEAFPEFMSSDLVAVMGDKPQWSVSDRDKRPIDIGWLMDAGELRGASPVDPWATVTLKKLRQVLPDAANAALRLDSEECGLCVLDVEPSCPPDEMLPLLRFPYVWGEVSMSGRGVHLVLPVPKAFEADADARSRAVVRDPKGRYEILLSHWVTFTRRPIGPWENRGGDAEAWEAFAKDLLERAPKPSIRVGADELDLEAARPKMPFCWKPVMKNVLGHPYQKGPDDFGGDMSRYEFGYMNFAYRVLVHSLEAFRDQWDYDENDKAWLLYDIAREALPKRAKHDETRLGVPYLLYRAKVVVAMADAELEDRAKKDGRA